MVTEMISPSQQNPEWRKWLVRSVAVVLLAAIGIGVWSIYRGIRNSIEAERTYHATLFTLRLVDHFVAEHGRWPSSWDELEAIPFKDDLFSKPWPDIAEEVRRRVQIEFKIDPTTVAHQDPEDFIAIQPIGPRFEFRDAGFGRSCVESLQQKLRTANK